MKLFKPILLAILLPVASFLLPEQAWALQAHGPPESIYVHQLAHIFYAAALGYLFWDIGRNAFPGKGWRYLQLFCILMIFWNLLTFSGHWLGFYIAETDMGHSTGYFATQLLGPLSSIKLIYFCASLDHLLSVPALFFLFMSLRSLYRSSGREEEN
jgi:hypothetical protein